MTIGNVARDVFRNGVGLIPAITDKRFGATDPTGVASSQTALVAALAYAKATSKFMFVPNGTYKATANIPYLQDPDVILFGPGVIARGSDTFPIHQTPDTVNKIYVDVVNGNDANDGLTMAVAIKTVARLFAVLPKYGPTLEGTWYGILASGTYPEVTEYPRGMRSRNLFRLQAATSPGASPAVPTVVFNGTGKGNSPAIEFDRDARCEIKDIKFTNYTGPAVSAQNYCLISGRNVHATNCGTSASAPYEIQTFSDIFVSGGLYNDTSATVYAGLIRALFHCRWSIGYYYDDATGNSVADGSLALGPQVTGTGGYGRGIYAAENTRGHVDHASINGFTKGVEITVTSRIHIDDCDFKNYATAIEVDVGCGFFGTGNTFDGSGKPIVLAPFAYDSVRIPGDAKSEYVKSSIVAWTLTGGTSLTSMGVIYAFDGKEFLPGDYIEVEVVGTFTGTAGTKNLSLRYGANLITGASINFAAAASGSFIFRAKVMVGATINTQDSWAVGMYSGAAQSVLNGSDTELITNGSAGNLNLYGQLGTGTDTIAVTRVTYKRAG